jgi:hypothetical protein|tara:strand:+ start:124 stop:435 length:312 start_codon:yes stop_codon:yes gene_type:complete
METRTYNLESIITVTTDRVKAEFATQPEIVQEAIDRFQSGDWGNVSDYIEQNNRQGVEALIAYARVGVRVVGYYGDLIIETNGTGLAGVCTISTTNEYFGLPY